MIACIDNLAGFAEAISTIFPQVIIQSCIVHQIRNSLKYIASKDQKEFMGDLKMVYQAPNLDLAELNLDKLEDKWGQKYPVVLGSWRRNWDKLTAYFAYDEHNRLKKAFVKPKRKMYFCRNLNTKYLPDRVYITLPMIYLAFISLMLKWL